jgi:hypothetical protein
MSSPGTAPEDVPVGAPRGRMRRAAGTTRELVRIAYRDPEHISERLTLYAAQNLAEPSREWAARVQRERPETPKPQIAEELRMQSANIARIDGAVAGTPFFIALVPGYLSYLWQEARMTLRTAALYGRDPADLHTAAEMLALRDVHPTVEQAEAALVAVAEKPPPVAARRSLLTWVRSVRMVLVFGGFLGPPSEGGRPSGARAWARAAAGAFAGFLLWATTWVLPVTFMIAMAWGCETHARRLGLRTVALYDGEAATSREAIAVARRETDPGHRTRRVLRTFALGLSIAVPVFIIAYADHERQHTGINGLGALAALIALSLVIAAAVYGSRR